MFFAPLSIFVLCVPCAVYTRIILFILQILCFIETNQENIFFFMTKSGCRTAQVAFIQHSWVCDSVIFNKVFIKSDIIVYQILGSYNNKTALTLSVMYCTL